jgi:hypothetical protein
LETGQGIGLTFHVELAAMVCGSSASLPQGWEAVATATHAAPCSQLVLPCICCYAAMCFTMCPLMVEMRE